MYSFFVLGIIPGTNIQITFAMWLDIALCILAGVIIVNFVRHLQNERTNDESHVRSPLHANQLHTRFI